MIRVLERLGIKVIYINIIKTVYSKPIFNLKFDREKGKAIALKSGTRWGCPVFSYLLNIVLPILGTEIEQQKDVKEYKLEMKCDL